MKSISGRAGREEAMRKVNGSLLRWYPGERGPRKSCLPRGFTRGNNTLRAAVDRGVSDKPGSCRRVNEGSRKEPLQTNRAVQSRGPAKAKPAEMPVPAPPLLLSLPETGRLSMPASSD